MKLRCKLCGEVVHGEDVIEVELRFNNHDCIADAGAYTLSDKDLVDRIQRECEIYHNKDEDKEDYDKWVD